MQREENVKAREVITALCRLLSTLGVESVPTAEVFRRAKFNKNEVTQDMWKLLYGLLSKVFQHDCACSKPQDSDLDTQLRFVRSALWYSGYGGSWVTRAQASRNIEEIGSRHLLLALGWVISSENLLESLLGEKVHELEVLSFNHRDVSGVNDLALRLSESGLDGAGGDVRTLQWQYGKLKLQWRNLLAAQKEQAKLTHKVLSEICSSSTSEASSADVLKSQGFSALDKDLERIKSLNGILEAYLKWKDMEPLFWFWLDSVIDGYLSDNCREGSTDTLLSDQAVTWSCSHNDQARRSMRHLEKMLLRLHTTRHLKGVGQSMHTLTSQDKHTIARLLSQEQKEEVEKRVAARLQALPGASTPTTTSGGFIPYLQESNAFRSTRKPHKGDPGRDMASGALQASQVLKELKDREAFLQWELELLRQSHREKIQAQASTLKGLVLIPPLKK
ncbi:tubulin epsilon and delta complex protein 1 isoform X2 [Hoplias malabaricus]|uniref:tubulin epsilon and delta complex protein 1 isoform X2 n=1 Tax=Hoplias malabaricus TaxID=27720 RepID=UPI0034633466